MATYFVKDINKEYTKVITDYINNGYHIHCNTMGGSQGEKASIHLMAPDQSHVLRVSLDNFSNWETCREGVEINVKKYSTSDMRSINDLSSSGDILWESQGKLINNKKFYKISNYKNSFYGDSVAADEAIKKHIERSKRHSVKFRYGFEFKDITSDKVVTTILPWVKRQYKCSSTLKKNISKVEKCMRYDEKPFYRVHLANKVLELKPAK